MSLEGELRVSVAWDGSGIPEVAIRSTRVDVAARVLPGKRVQEAAELVPRLFSVCGRSQGTAAAMACDAALGRDVSDRIAAGERAVAAEIAREYGRQALVDWPLWLGESPDGAALARSRGAFSASDERPGTLRDVAEQSIFGGAIEEWLEMSDLAALDTWIAKTPTPAARLLGRLRSWKAGPGHEDVSLLPPIGRDAAAAALAASISYDPGFARAPTWNGRPAETGALARMQDDSLVAALGRSALARMTARLRELAHLIAGTRRPRLDAISLGPGSAIAWLENARGLLAHYVEIDGDRIASYRLVAPTEWNFHPQGPLAQELKKSRFADEGELRRGAALLAQSFDPCVACAIELRHA